MSRIGKSPVSIPQGVDVNLNDNLITVKGKLGELSQTISEGITVKIENDQIVLERASESKTHKSQHGLCRALLNNMVEGVTNGYKKELNMNGVGYTAELKNDFLLVNAGYSHPVYLEIPTEVKIEVPNP